MHVMRGELRSFFDNSMGSEDRNRILRHLLSGCRICRQLASDVFAHEEPPAEYDAVFWRLMSTRSAWPSEPRSERLRAREQWAYLERLSPRQRQLRINNDPSYLTYGLYERLLEVSKERARDEPIDAVELARLALAVAEKLDGASYGEPTILEIRTAALAALGNAQRLAADFEAAAGSLALAERILLEQDDCDRLELAHIYSLTASLLTDLGRFDKAVAVLAKARAIYERVRDRHMIGRVNIQEALAIGYVDPERGVALLRDAHALIDGHREPRLELSIRHTSAFFLCDLGRPEEAQELLQKSRWLYHRFGDRAAQIRRLWLEAKIHRGMGRLAEAEAILTGTAEELLRYGLHQEYVLMMIDLAENFAAQGRLDETLDIVGQIHSSLAGWGMHEEGLAVLLLALRSLREKQVRGSIFRELTTYLRRAWNRPQHAG